jgi:hypothetical protein
MIRVKSTHEYGVRSQADNLLSESGSPQDTSRCATYLFGFAEPSGAPYQQQGPRYPATSCDGQCRSGLNTSVLPRARLEYHVQPQQTGGDYKNTCLKIMVDALTSGSTFFDQSACQIKSGSGYKSRYRDRRCDAYQWNESKTPGTRNARTIAVSAMAPDCQRIMIAVRISLFSA